MKYVINNLDRSLKPVMSKEQEKKEQEEIEKIKKKDPNYNIPKRNIMRNLILIALNDYTGLGYGVAIEIARRIREAKTKVTLDKTQKGVLEEAINQKCNNPDPKENWPSFLKGGIINSIVEV